MRELKICLVSLTFAPDSQDGSAKFITGVYNYLKSQGHKVKVITGLWNQKLDNPDIIQVKIIKKSFLWVPQFIFFVIKYLKKNKFDIIHSNGPKGSMPLLLLRNLNFISTIHDLGPIETNFSIIPFERFLIEKTIKRAKFITTCSESIKQQILALFEDVPSNKIFNLYSAIESKFKPHIAESTILKEKLGLNGPILLYIGRIANYKGVPDIINAYNMVKNQIEDLELVIGGTPDFSMRDTYQTWKNKYPDIHFVGFVPLNQIAIYYTMADVFITYSYASEGFGLTPIEAIACGTPVICSDIKVFREILQDNAIFVKPKNPKLLSEAIYRLLTNESDRIKLIEKAQNYIKRFSWDSVGHKMEEVYKKKLKI
jgi:glycosyltransferase involved in cell wall biosynthesis